MQIIPLAAKNYNLELEKGEMVSIRIPEFAAYLEIDTTSREVTLWSNGKVGEGFKWRGNGVAVKKSSGAEGGRI